MRQAAIKLSISAAERGAQKTKNGILVRAAIHLDEHCYEFKACRERRREGGGGRGVHGEKEREWKERETCLQSRW